MSTKKFVFPGGSYHFCLVIRVPFACDTTQVNILVYLQSVACGSCAVAVCNYSYRSAVTGSLTAARMA